MSKKKLVDSTEIYEAPWPSWAEYITEEEFQKLPKEKQEAIEAMEGMLDAMARMAWKSGVKKID